MKLSIIGGGNMGGAIARGLAQGTLFQPSDITVIDAFEAPLQALKIDYPNLQTALKDYTSIADADIIILAVKPWMIQDVIVDIKHLMDHSRQILISIAAGINIADLEGFSRKPDDSIPTIIRVVPNTAIAVRQSMTLLSTNNALPEQEELILRIFNELGWAVKIEENKIAAGTALTSCGIAYLFRYVRAAMLAGVEMGFYPAQAQDMIVKTMLGAASLMDKNKEHPEVEIDKVTTPGGITIKGINTLDAYGFTAAIIQAIKASNPTL